MPDDGKMITDRIEEQPKGYIWQPKEDITAYELAKALEVLLTAAGGASWVASKMVENLPDNVRRHFEEITG